MATKRRSPYVWVSWLTPILSGDNACEWAPWYQSNFQFVKLDRGGFNLATWKVEHADMVSARVDELRREGYLCYLEDQNSFTLRGTTATLAGKPDIVAVRGAEGRVVDYKSGKRRSSDIQQVLVYLYAIPRYHPAFTPDMRLAGEVRYRDGSIEIAPDDFTDAMRDRIIDLVRRMGSPSPPARVPSARECAWCPVGPVDCPDRIEQAQAAVAVGEW